MNNKKKLIVLTGPTAVGKSELSIKLAKEINGSIISADSMQVYKYMNIGTAKITKEQMQGVKHYLIDEIEPDEEFNVMIFKKKALEYMNEIYSNGEIPILVGGTGFYIQSILYDIQFTESDSKVDYRSMLENEAIKNGIQYLYDELKKIDIESANVIHPNNTKRIIRALEYYYLTGQRFSEHNAEQKQNESPYDYKYFVLNDERSHIYEKIDKRVDKMIEDGLVLEVSKLYNMGYGQNLVSMQGLGYKEIISYLNGECSLDKSIDLLKKGTRHFAKRQLTWFRREKSVIWLNKQDFNYNESLILNEIIRHI